VIPSVAHRFENESLSVSKLNLFLYYLNESPLLFPTGMLELSLSRTFAPESEDTMELSLPGAKRWWNFCSQSETDNVII